MADDVIASILQAKEHPRIAEAMATRAELMAATQANYQAVLSPQEPGGLSHAERLALAHRIALLNADAPLAQHYTQAPGNEPSLTSSLGDPKAAVPQDARMTAMLRHLDLVTRAPRTATKADIAALKAAGISEADIVRLSQLIAFVNYQLRVIAGLRLIGEVA